jgi:hypothetical protein
MLTDDEINDFVNDVMADDPDNAPKLKSIVQHMIENFDEEKINRMLDDVETMNHKEFFRKYCLKYK